MHCHRNARFPACRTTSRSAARTFFGDEDYARYRDLLAKSCARAQVAVWVWVLMPNHVHLVLARSDANRLRAALARTHRR